MSATTLSRLFARLAARMRPPIINSAAPGRADLAPAASYPLTQLVLEKEH
jgi:hypothetical protein